MPQGAPSALYPELVQDGLDIGRIKFFLDQGTVAQKRILISQGGALNLVEYTDGNTLSPLPGPLPSGLAIVGLMPLDVEVVNPRPVPLIGVDLVKGDTGLENIYKGKAWVLNCGLDCAHQVLSISGVAAGDKASIHGDGQGQGVQGLVADAIGGGAGDHALIR